MSQSVRVLRFARPADPLASAPRGGQVVADVLLDEQPAPLGRIVQQFEAWHYQPADRANVKLVSTLSRQDIEAQIARLYFGPEHGFDIKPSDLPLAM